MHFFQPTDPWTPPGFVLPVPAHLDRCVPEQRIAEAAGHLGEHGALTGWPVLRLLAARYLDGLARDGRTPLPVPLAMGPCNGRRERPGVRFLYDRMEPVSTVRGLPCLPAVRAVFDEMRHQRRLFDAVVALDMAVLAGVVTIEEVAEYVEGRVRWNGVPLARKALRLADPHSASPPEVRLRLFWQVTMRLPRPLVNVGVFDLDGRLAGYPDLLDLEAGLVIEYDGLDHLPEERRSKDVDREGELRDLGLEVVHVVSRDMRQPKLLRERLTRARRRARFDRVGLRRWTVEPERPQSCPRSCSCRRRRLGGL